MITRSLLTLLLSIALFGCTTTNQTIPMPPAWKAPTVDKIITAQDIKVGMAQKYPGVPVYLSDSYYTEVSYDWNQDMMTWMYNLQLNGIIKFTPESYDCDDFSVTYYWGCSISAGKAGQQAAPLVARVIVSQLVTVMTVPGAPNTRHELIGVVTDKGMYIVEPQPNAGPFRLTPLEKYPNKILSVVFGDFNPP